MGRPFAEEESAPWERGEEASFANELLEAQLLSSLHNDPAKAARVDPAWLMDPLHVDIARGMAALVAAGETKFEDGALFAAIGKKASDKLEGVVNGKPIGTVGNFLRYLRNQSGFAASPDFYMAELQALWIRREIKVMSAHANGGSAVEGVAQLWAKLEALRGGSASPRASFVSGRDMIARRRPPDYVIDGLMQRGFIYAFTAQAGSGKTAIALRMAQCLSVGTPFGAHELRQGHVYYFSGENPEDVTDRLIGMAAQGPLDLDRLHFYPDAVSIATLLPSLAPMVPDAALIIVDTCAAYFFGDEENSNTQMAEHAKTLRKLTFLPGFPAVLVLCHPAKSAHEKDALVPRGGGAFLGQLDGNFIAIKSEDGLVDMHWTQKMRGTPDFQPIQFKLETAEADSLVDARGRSMPTVAANFIDAQQRRATEIRAENDKDAILLGLDAGKETMDELEAFVRVQTMTNISRATIGRRCQDMVKPPGNVLAKVRDRYVLNDRGKAEVKRLKARAAEAAADRRAGDD